MDQGTLKDLSPAAQQYIIAAFHEAELIVRETGSHESNEARLREIQESFDKTGRGRSGGSASDKADRFWDEIAFRFLPAVDRKDAAATSASFARLLTIYRPFNQMTPDMKGHLKTEDTKGNVTWIDPEASKAAKETAPANVTWLLTAFAATACTLATVALFLWFRRKRQLAAIVNKAAQLREAEKQAHVMLDAKLQALRQRLFDHGRPRQKDGRLFFGDYVVNGNNEIVDEVKNKFDCFATVFMGDKRIATNVLLNNGLRALDTPLVHGPAYETVMQKKRIFAGQVNLFGRIILSLYEPIMDGPDVIGILFVGC